MRDIPTAADALAPIGGASPDLLRSEASSGQTYALFAFTLSVRV